MDTNDCRHVLPYKGYTVISVSIETALRRLRSGRPIEDIEPQLLRIIEILDRCEPLSGLLGQQVTQEAVNVRTRSGTEVHRVVPATPSRRVLSCNGMFVTDTMQETEDDLTCMHCCRLHASDPRGPGERG